MAADESRGERLETAWLRYGRGLEMLLLGMVLCAGLGALVADFLEWSIRCAVITGSVAGGLTFAWLGVRAFDEEEADL